jgi:predicted dehydrogenase
MTDEVQVVRVGVVGAGAIFRDRHAPGFATVPGVQLEAVVNSSLTSSERAREEFGFARVHADWRALVADPSIDAVLIGTWPYLHKPVFEASLDAGKHVLTQARLATDADEGRAMLAAALARPDLTAMVVPSPLSLWADACVRRLLVDGAIGSLRLVRVFSGGGSGEVPLRQQWRRDRRLSGNNVMSLGILYEALARWFGHASWVQAVEQIVDPGGPDGPTDVPDLVSITASLPGGAVMTLDMSPHARFGEGTGAWLYGSSGTLHVDLDARRLTLHRQGAEPEVVEPRPEERGDWQVEQEFVGAIRGENTVRLTDIPTAVRYMEFTDAVRRAAGSGARERVSAV